MDALSADEGAVELPSEPGLTLEKLLGRGLAITTTDDRLFIGHFQCVDQKVNVILVNTEEFRPAPKTKEDLEQKDLEEKWLPRSHRMLGDPDWTNWANMPNNDQTPTQSLVPSEDTARNQGDPAWEEEGRREESTTIDTAENSSSDWPGRGTGVHQKGRSTAGNRLEGIIPHTDVENLQARHLERVDSQDSSLAGVRVGDDPLREDPDVPMPHHDSSHTAGLRYWRWGYGRGEGRSLGMVMIPGEHIVKVELVHGGPVLEERAAK